MGAYTQCPRLYDGTGFDAGEISGCAEHLVTGHGISTSANKEVRQRMKNARDLVKFTSDLVQQSVTAGLTPDQILENIRFPAYLEATPYLQPFYHRKDWIIRGMHTTWVGWDTGIGALTRLTAGEEAKRLIALLGGEEAVLEQGRNALTRENIAGR
jgi:alkyl sulfatase BDS1-like metallo-beta-lactamase superfamily hydrolase